MNADGHTLHWPGRVLAAEDLRRSLNGHRAVIVASGAVVTPSAAEHLRSNGIRLGRTEAVVATEKLSWGYAQDRPYPSVAAAVAALRREGFTLVELARDTTDPSCRWSLAVAKYVARGDCQGAVVFCEDPGLVSCVANKVAGLRTVAVVTVGQAARATLTLGANLLAVEMPGRTYFEVRQILRTLCSASACPDGIADTLRELDGHAHR